MPSSNPPFSKRNLLLLAGCQAIGQAANTMMFLSTALSVVTFMTYRDLATLPMTLQHLGVMLSVFPAAMLMQRHGRKFGFRIGSIVGMLGSAVTGTGLYFANFPLMCLGGLVLGFAVANLQMYRFAAVELVPPQIRAKAISWVTAGGVVAAVLGPSLARWTHDMLMPLYMATYFAMIGMHIVVFATMSFIKFPDMTQAAANPGTVAELPARSLWVIAAQPRFFVPVIAAMMAYGTMSFLMSASPLAIVGCGLAHTEAHGVMILHVLGMFVPSFFTGNLIQRYGVTNIMLWGAAVLLAGIATALAGIDIWNFRVSLMLNGVGWNFLFIGATTMVTTTYRPSERGKTQALNDFLTFGTTATASFFAGFLQEHLGWFPLNWFSLGLVATAVVAVGWLRLCRPRLATAAA